MHFLQRDFVRKILYGSPANWWTLLPNPFHYGGKLYRHMWYHLGRMKLLGDGISPLECLIITCPA